LSDHPGGGEVDEQPDVPESSRAVVASVNDICDTKDNVILKVLVNENN